jgi:hypothetical protein
MPRKRKAKTTVRTVEGISNDSFWEAASRERDPVKILKITRQIDGAIREHERNVYSILPTGRKA